MSGLEGFAGVSLISQTRTLDASAQSTSGAVTAGPFADSASAADFGVFDEAIQPLAVAINSPYVSIAQGVAKQNSVLG
ncbi:MAG: hypothetical protein AB7O66_12290, partial [Limisphaerales bacterium]